jgi:hypothetical protein
MKHVLVIANETVAGQSLIQALEKRSAEGELLVTVICPVNQPREGYVVYEDTRRASAGRRLDRTLEALRAAGIRASGFVVDADPVAAVRDALIQLEPRPDEIVVSTHPRQRSGWLRRDVVERIRRAAEGLPVEHVVVDLAAEGLPFDVTLVVANQTAAAPELVERLKALALEGPRRFIVVVPQSSVQGHAVREARERLATLLESLDESEIVAAGMIGDPDPYTATMNAVQYFHISEIVISTLPEDRSKWVADKLVDRVRGATNLPVEHIESSASVGA